MLCVTVVGESNRQFERMALVITDESHVPPGGSYVAFCDCQLCLTAPKRAEFRKHYVDWVVSEYNVHLRSNGLPELSREEIVQRICRDTPANICAGDGYQYRERRLGWQDVVNGTNVLFAFKLAGSPLVSPELANERAAICANCQENVPYAQNCSTCKHVEDAVRAVIGDLSTPLDGRLNACFICGCSNKAQVWLPSEILAKGVNAEMMERFNAVRVTLADGNVDCWKARELSAL